MSYEAAVDACAADLRWLYSKYPGALDGSKREEFQHQCNLLFLKYNQTDGEMSAYTRASERVQMEQNRARNS